MKVSRETKKGLGFRKNSFRENFELSLLALPGFLHMLLVCYIPMVGVIIAFKKFNPNLGIWASKWVGFDNFKFFFTSNDFVRIMRNTLLYGAGFLVLDNLASIAMAIVLYNITSRKVLKFYQTAIILPKFMSAVLIAFIVYALLNPVSGIINQVIIFFGGAGKDWYSEANYWPFILTVVHLWQIVGMSSIIYYACLMGIDETLFEAARIDGANKWHEIKYIIVPEIMGLLCIQIILGVGSLVSGDFGLFYQTPMNVGVLYSTTDIINTYVFRALQEATNMGRTAAVGLFQSVAGLILVVTSNLIVKKISPEKSFF
ncbi:MAG: ABC transporter permease subunit [Clostridia bacterium]|nr:ABC transporter permease subunit [Clostridia bacterium]